MSSFRTFAFVAVGASIITSVLATDFFTCNDNMDDLTACFLQSKCYNCLASDTPSGDPAKDICDSFVCPVLGEVNCCPQCKNQAEKMKDCIVGVVVSNGGSGVACSCGKEIPESDSCMVAIEEYDKCVIDGEVDCMSCSVPLADDLTSVTIGTGNCQSINEEFCIAAECCCRSELEAVVQCALDDVESTCQIQGCDSQSPEDEMSSTTTTTEAPTDIQNACTSAIGEYNDCISGGGAFCLSCSSSFILDLTSASGITSNCQGLSEQYCIATQCCCGSQLENVVQCALENAGSTCEMEDCNSQLSEEDPSPDNLGEQEKGATCPELAAEYEECASKTENCLACVDETAVVSPRSFGEGSSESGSGGTPQSCQAVHETICPYAACCCSAELEAVAECSHLEKHSVSCDIDCAGYDPTPDSG